VYYPAKLNSVASSDEPRTGTGLPTLDVETRLMQNYRVDAPVSAGATVEAVCNGEGAVELFTLGTDGTIWNFYPDSTSQSGYSGVSTGLQASTFGVGRGSDGRVVLFAAYRLQLSFVVEEPGASSRWSTPKTLAYEQPQEASMIARILVSEIAGQLYVGALVEFSSLGEVLYQLVYCVWHGAETPFVSTKMSVSSTNCAWLGSTAATAAFACADIVIVSLSIESGEIGRYPMAATFETVSVDCANDGAGNTQLLAVLADGNAYRLIGGAKQQPYSWQQISTGMNFRQIAADTDAAGRVHAFAVSGGNALYHWQPNAGSPTGFDDATAIAAAVARISLAADDNGEIDVFAVGTAQSMLTHVFQEQASSNWTAETVEVPASGKVEEYVSYTSDVQVSDAAGALLANAPVTISATQRTRIAVNGQVYFVGPGHPLNTSTNGAGLLSIARETGSLATPALGVNITGQMPPGQTLTIEQSKVAQTRLAATTGPELMTASVASGGYLLEDSYRTQQTTDSLASALQACMSVTGATRAQAQPLAGRRRSNLGVGVLHTGELDGLHRLSVPAGQHWRLAFDENGLLYEALAPDRATALIAERRAGAASVLGLFDWLDDIGDFVAGVVDGAIEIVETIVTTVGDAVKAVITCVINGVEYLYEAIVETVEAAFDLVELVFAHVKVAFEKVFEWLGFLFAWGDMVRTHEALAYTIGEFLTFLVGAAAGTQKIVDDGIATLKSELQKLFDEAVTKIAGQSSLGGYERANEKSSPELSAAAANNPFYTGFIDGVHGARSLVAALPDEHRAELEPLMAQLLAYAQSTEGTSAFGEALTYVENLGGSPEEIFQQLLSALLRLAEGVLDAILAGAQAVIDALLAAVQAIIAALRAVLTEPWEIPLISSLYSWITDGSELTTLDLTAMIAAIPTTIFYKVLYDEAPFPDAASVTAFKASFNAQAMLKAAGLPSGEQAAGELSEEGGIVLSPQMQRLLLVGGGVTTMFYGGCSAVADAWPPPASPRALSKVILLLEAAELAFTFPWFYSNTAPVCTEAEGRQAILWLYCTTGAMVNGYFVYQEGTVSEVSSDKGVIVAFIWGLGYTAAAIAASVGQESGLTIASNILPVVPMLAVPLRHTKVIAATDGISLPVLGAIDAAFYVATGVITAVSPVEGTAALANPTNREDRT
jgi:hypothetical protein